MADEGKQTGGDAWGDDIPPERQKELEVLFQHQAAWVFKEVRLTGADVFWLAARTLAGTDERQAVAEQVKRLRRARDNLRLQLEPRLDALHLEGANLTEAHLEDAILTAAHLEDTILRRVHLERATLYGAHLEDTTLYGARLEDTLLREANLKAANLRTAHLERADLGAAHLEHANLSDAHLERATLYAAHLEHANLSDAHLERATLYAAHLEHAFLSRSHVEGADLIAAHLEGTFQTMVNLERANLSTAHLEGAMLERAHLERAHLYGVHLERAYLNNTNLKGATLPAAHLEGATLIEAHLEGALLSQAHLEGANLSQAHLEGANLSQAHLEGRVYEDGADDEADYQRVQQWVQQWDEFPRTRTFAPADLRHAVLDGATNLSNVALGRPGDGQWQGYVRVADVSWGGVNLAVIKDWPATMKLGDEHAAWAWKRPQREVAKPASTASKKPSRKEQAAARRQQEQAWQKQATEAAQERLELFRAAVRANRQLAMALREQGMNEEADRFAYRAQVCQRQVFRLRHQRVRQAFSWLLDVVSGHGYQPGKTLVWYLGVLAVFACAYFAATHGALTFGLPRSQVQPLAWYEALVLSVSSFHGRGFFQPVQSLGDPVAILAAIEAVFGLFIEVSFIATFTQRYFAK